MIKSINVQINKFGAVEVSAQIAGSKETIEMLVMSDGNNEYTVNVSTGFTAARVFGTWEFERKTEDKILRTMFNQAWVLFEANKPESVKEEQPTE